MAKNFKKSPAAKRFDEVAKTSMANTNAASIELIENSALIDYPGNGEDISYTSDIENSINELGFTDPIEITDFKMADGKYMILSGHRRRAAGVKCGMDLFPCIIKPFENENDVQNYVLLANSQRDSSKDPLLYCSRYKMHEQHLKSINFKGSVREEIAKRLGVSVQQADRYNQMNKIISPVWDLVRGDLTGMSSVLPMSALNHDEQREVFEILKKFIDGGSELTREKVKKIIEDYKNQDSSKSPHREDFYKKNHPDNLEYQKPSNKDIIKSIKAFNDNLSRNWDLEDKKDVKILLNEMEHTFDLILGKYYTISKRYDFDREIQKVMENIKETIENIK